MRPCSAGVLLASVMWQEPPRPFCIILLVFRYSLASRSSGGVFSLLKTPEFHFFAAGVALVVNIVLNLLLMGPMGFAGLALATSLASGVNLIILARYFTRDTGPGWFNQELRKEILYSFAAATLMLLVTGVLAGTIHWMELTTLNRVLYLVGCMGLGIGVYSITAWTLGCKGMKTLINKVFNRQ